MYSVTAAAAAAAAAATAEAQQESSSAAATGHGLTEVGHLRRSSDLGCQAAGPSSALCGQLNFSSLPNAAPSARTSLELGLAAQASPSAPASVAAAMTAAPHASKRDSSSGSSSSGRGSKGVGGLQTKRGLAASAGLLSPLQQQQQQQEQGFSHCMASAWEVGAARGPLLCSTAPLMLVQFSVEACTRTYLKYACTHTCAQTVTHTHMSTQVGGGHNRDGLPKQAAAGSSPAPLPPTLRALTPMVTTSTDGCVMLRAVGELWLAMHSQRV